MRKILLVVLINLILVLVQTSFIPELTSKYIVPNLVLAFGFYLLLVDRLDYGLQSVLIGGVMLDAINNNHIGISAVIMTASLFLAFLIRKYLFKGLVSHALLVMLSSIIFSQVVVFKSWSINMSTLISAVITAVLSLLLLYIKRYEKSYFRSGKNQGFRLGERI